MISSLCSQQFWEVSLIIPVLQVRKLSFRKMKGFELSATELVRGRVGKVGTKVCITNKSTHTKVISEFKTFKSYLLLPLLCSQSTWFRPLLCRLHLMGFFSTWAYGADTK